MPGVPICCSSEVKKRVLEMFSPYAIVFVSYLCGIVAAGPETGWKHFPKKPIAGQPLGGQEDSGWRPLSPLVPAITSFGSAIVPGGSIFVVGGYDHMSSAPSGLVNTTQWIDVSNPAERWSSTDSLAIPRSNFGASYAPALGPTAVLALGGFIGTEIIDGASYSHLTADVAVFDASTGASLDGTGVPPLPKELEGVGAAALPSGEVVIAGGFGYESDGSFFYSQETFVLRKEDDGSFFWDQAEDFPWPRSGMSCSTTSKGVLCSGGGYTDPAYAEAAMFNGSHWTEVSPMLEPRNWAGSAHANVAAPGSDTPTEVVYAVGGYCCQGLCFFSPLASVERFDVAAGVWSEATPLPSPHASGGAAGAPALTNETTSSRVFAIGGDQLGTVVVAVDP